MATIDRRGVSVDATDTPIAGDPNPGLAVKAPCFVGTTGNITLFGLQTVDGVAVAEGNRVLVMSQGDPTTNGIYNASAGTWTRAVDAQTNDQFAQGMQVLVASGTMWGRSGFSLTTADPVVLGTSSLNFAVTGVGVGASRQVNTTAPLQGGGDLSVNRTLSIEGNGITYALLQQVGADKIVGNPSGAPATASEITLGATLGFSGQALQTEAGTGDVTWNANSFATTIGANKVTNAKIAQMAANSLKGNSTGALANATDIVVPSLVVKGAPAAGDVLMLFDSASSFLMSQTTIADLLAQGVSGFNSRHGAVSPAQGDYSTSLIPGTTTNDNATAGNIGEFVSSTSTGAATTVTISIASPAVITDTAHGKTANSPVTFTTTGALPTGLTAGTTYYVIGASITTNTYEVATSIANAIAGTALNTSGTQSGTQTATASANLTTTVAKDIIGLSLTAGDWDVSGSTQFAVGASTSTTFQGQWISKVSATFSSALVNGYSSYNGGALVNFNNALATGVVRLSLAATTTIYLSVQATFTVSTTMAWSMIRARRVR